MQLKIVPHNFNYPQKYHTINSVARITRNFSQQAHTELRQTVSPQGLLYFMLTPVKLSFVTTAVKC